MFGHVTDGMLRTTTYTATNLMRLQTAMLMTNGLASLLLHCVLAQSTRSFLGRFSGGCASYGQEQQKIQICEFLVTEKCVLLGHGGHGSLLDALTSSVLGASSLRIADSRGDLACSGHGRCTSTWQECGKGTQNFSATPCCTCDFGFAGEGCEYLDARVYIVLAAGCILALLMLLMLFMWILRSIWSSRLVGRGTIDRQMYSEPLLSS